MERFIRFPFISSLLSLCKRGGRAEDKPTMKKNDYSDMFEPKHDNGFEEYDRNTKWLGVALLALFILGVIWANYQGLTVAL